MKISGIRHIISLWILLSALSVSSQNLGETIVYGDECLARNDYSAAIQVYSRALFFSPDSLYSELFFKLGNCQELTAEYSKAAVSYQRSAETSDSDSFRIARIFDKARCELELNNWLQALSDLYSLPDSLSDSEQMRLDFYLGTISFGQENFEEASYHFIAALGIHGLADSSLIDSLLTSNPMMYRPIPKRAKALSIIIPGLGQLYSGDYRNAANSFILTGGLVSLAFIVAARYGVINAFFTIMPWYQRYFTGGFTNSEAIAERKRAENRADVYQQVLRIIAESQQE